MLKFVPSIRGKIKQIILVYDSTNKSFVSIIQQLQEKLANDVQIIIYLRHDSDLKDFKHVKFKKNIAISKKFNSNLSQWVRDAIITFTDGKELKLILEFANEGDLNPLNDGLAEHISQGKFKTKQL